MEPLKPKIRKCFIYFIQQGDDGPIKIGYSADPRQRMQQLATAHAKPLRLLATIPGTEQKEKEIHESLKAFRLSGEWFENHPEVMRTILEAMQREVDFYFGAYERIIDDVGSKLINQQCHLFDIFDLERELGNHPVAARLDEIWKDYEKRRAEYCPDVVSYGGRMHSMLLDWKQQHFIPHHLLEKISYLANHQIRLW